jgi:Domain of unknown function (DUF4082)/Cohesin domain
MTTLPRFSALLRALRATALFGCALVAFGQTASLSLSPASGTTGSTVSLPLAYVSNGTQVAGLQWTFSFAAADFTDVSVTAGPAATGAGKNLTCNAAASGQYICLASGLNTTTISDGTLATATFTVSGATTATSSVINLLSASAASGAGAAIDASGSGATITINGQPSPVSLSSLACTPTSVTAPGSSLCTVALSGPAPSGGSVVSIGSTSTSAATISTPASVTVPASSTTAQFSAQIGSATAATTVQVSASLGSITKAISINVTPAPSVAVSVAPSSVTLGPGGTQQFMATVTGSSNTSVAWSLSPSTGSISSTGLYTAPSSVTTQQTVTLRATSAADSTKFATATVVVNPPVTSAPVSFWPATAKPGTASASDTSAVELGLKFSSSVAGSVTGVRFYKGTKNTGTHVGHLWSASGTLLASVTFTNETGSGWQQANFSTPVNISANTVYVISYFAPKGGYASNQSFAWSGLSAPPLSVSGSSPGVYAYGSTSSLPNNTWSASNYWVDVVFSAASGPTVAVSLSPSNVTLGPGSTQQFTATVSGASNTSVTWSLSSSTGAISSSGLYTAPSSMSTQQTVTVRATSIADATKSATATVTVNPPATSAPLSFWPSTAAPGTSSDPDTGSIELGLQFSSSVAGSVTGVRFYKGSSNTGTHIGHLWSAAGALLATVTFTNETASGWQQANFSTPVQITANTAYVISYFAPNGRYADDENYNWAAVNAASLAVSGAAPGVYAYGSTAAFPNNTWNGSNYWVDVVFSPGQ